MFLRTNRMLWMFLSRCRREGYLAWPSESSHVVSACLWGLKRSWAQATTGLWQGVACVGKMLLKMHCKTRNSKWLYNMIRRSCGLDNYVLQLRTWLCFSRRATAWKHLCDFLKNNSGLGVSIVWLSAPVTVKQHQHCVQFSIFTRHMSFNREL